jgi:hypothetical protein
MLFGISLTFLECYWAKRLDTEILHVDATYTLFIQSFSDSIHIKYWSAIHWFLALDDAHWTTHLLAPSMALR